MIRANSKGPVDKILEDSNFQYNPKIYTNIKTL